MGWYDYDEKAHRALTDKHASKPVEEVFTSRDIHESLNPLGLRVRESRDSDNHPRSRGIVFVIDQTGSMANIPVQLAQRTLPTFMTAVIDEGTVEDPQVLFMAIGDALSGNGAERAPLQVGQFESEAKLMDKDLTNIFLERKGGNNEGESYDLAIYAAARHTSMDCVEKRNEKGYFFVTGDEPGFRRVSASAVRRLIGDELASDIPLEDAVAELAKTFHPFFLIPDLDRRHNCESFWREYLGDNVIPMESPDDTCLVAATLIGLTEGSYGDLNAVQASLASRGVARDQVARVCRAVSQYAASIGCGGARRPTDDVDPPAGPAPRGRGRR